MPFFVAIPKDVFYNDYRRSKLIKASFSKKDIEEFKKTPIGIRKYMWMLGGISIDVIAMVGVFILIKRAYHGANSFYFYTILFLLLVSVIIGGELVGMYFGSLEQYARDKGSLKNNE